MRLGLVLALILGFTPGLGEIAETVVHYAVQGHLAHSDADQGDLGDLGHHHGCGGTQHVCGCCTAQAFVAQPVVVTSRALEPHASAPMDDRQLESLHDPAPPHRPPIAS